MASRNLLTKKKLPQFRRWLEDKTNCRIEETKGGYECLRFRINDTLHIVFENHRTMHLSLQSKTVYLVQQFLRERRKQNKRDMEKRIFDIKKSQGEISQTGKDYEVSCLFCGKKENLKIYPHRSKSSMHGMIYSCCPIPEDHKFFLMPKEAQDFVMIPQEIFDSLTTEVALEMAEHSHKNSSLFEGQEENDGEPIQGKRYHIQAFYDAIHYLRNAKLKADSEEPIFKRPIIDPELT